MPLSLGGLSVLLSINKIYTWVINLFTIPWNLLASHELPIALLWFEDFLVALLQGMVFLLYQLLGKFSFAQSKVVVVSFWQALHSAVIIIFSKLNLGWVLGRDTPKLHSASAALALPQDSRLYVAKFIIVRIAFECMLRRLSNIFVEIFLLCLTFRPKSFAISCCTALYSAVWLHISVNPSSYYWLRTSVIQKALLVLRVNKRIGQFPSSAPMFLLSFNVSFLRQILFESTGEELLFMICSSSVSAF